ncbi:MAG: exosortase/archaeosortase family protein [Syntrophobacteraceae bacterium]
MPNDKGPDSLDTFPATLPAEIFSNGGRRRLILYFVALVVGIGLFFLPLKALFQMSFKSELYDYIPWMFPLCGYLLVSERRQIFTRTDWSLGWGAPVLLLSLAVGAAGLKLGLGHEDYLCVLSFSFWLFLMGTFLLFFGPGAFRKASFPLFMLLFTVPLPARVLSETVGLLREGSYLSASWLFHLTGLVPIERGFSFTFPEISIEVARECSGIHACTAMVILALLSGRYFLRSKINRTLLAILAVPIATFKNGVRIYALTLAAIYIDPNILSTYWHRDGGVIIFSLGAGILVLVLLGMRKLEKRQVGKSKV